jgi:hypothetical protein
MTEEKQAFLLFHSSIALSSLARVYGGVARDRVQGVLQKSLEAVRGFKGGPPDRNTIDVLEMALSQLQQSH